MRVRVSRNPLVLVVVGFVMVLNLLIGIGVKLPFIPSVGDSLKSFAGPLVCPESSSLKVYSSPSTWRDSDGRTHHGTGYSFDCVNSTGNHVENKIDLYFGIFMASLFVIPIGFVMVLFVVVQKLKQRQMEQVNAG